MSRSCKRASKVLAWSQGQADLFGLKVEHGPAEGVNGGAGPFTPAGGGFEDDRPLHRGKIARRRGCEPSRHDFLVRRQCDSPPEKGLLKGASKVVVRFRRGPAGILGAGSLGAWPGRPLRGSRLQYMNPYAQERLSRGNGSNASAGPYSCVWPSLVDGPFGEGGRGRCLMGGTLAIGYA
jgi:hypothetical protein